MNKLFIDFDGVILDTWYIIFNEYYKKYDTDTIDDIKLKKIMLELGWENILKNSNEINNGIEKIRYLEKKYEVCILTKVNSSQEKKAKKNFLLNKGIKNFCFVPYNISKSLFVNPDNNILVDDDIKNLDEWKKSGGKSIFFNKNLTNIDSYGNYNKNYIVINDLLKLYDIII